MPSLVGTDVTANYLKASPSTQFGTRQLSVIKVVQAAVFVNYADSNSLFSKSVRALQQSAEVYAVFTPVDAGTDYFCAIIATDTQWDGAGTGTGATLPSDGSFDALEAAIAAGSGVSATVTLATIS
jgi:hypothetical protein